MKKIIIIFTLLLYTLNLYANETKTVMQKDFEDKIVTVDLNGYKILKFSKSIMKIQFDSSEYIEADFLKDSTDQPLSTLKVKGKKIGKQNSIVTFYDDSIINVKFNIVKNMNDIIQLVNKLYPNIEVSQINDTIILQGFVKNQTQKSKLIEIFEKYGIDVKTQLIDLVKDNHSTKMVRVKLYVVQIDNNNGQQLINDWNISGFNDGKTSFDGDFTANITSLTGGITAVAQRMGSKFDIGLTLNYLRKNNAARIVNESTLIMKENQNAKFNTGGKFFIKSSTTTAEGVPSTELKEIEYGLNITMKAKKIIENQYIDFEAMAKSDDVDYDNTVDDIPGLIGNEVTTNVLIENGSTIVLAGILKIDYTKNEEKVPGLGDIPLLGQLFTSSDTRDESYDLVFFMTPEIIDPMNNNEEDILRKKLDKVKSKDYTKQVYGEKNIETKIEKKEEIKTSIEAINSSPKELTNEEKHRLRVKEILGY